jgi:hypothetical protein
MEAATPSAACRGAAPSPQVRALVIFSITLGAAFRFLVATFVAVARIWCRIFLVRPFVTRLFVLGLSRLSDQSGVDLEPRFHNTFTSTVPVALLELLLEVFTAPLH